jgi:HEAT repeat protein
VRQRDEPLDSLVAELRALGATKPTPERRAIVRDALFHKREGVQSVAAQVLGSWGGQESVAELRLWLARLDERHEPFIGPRGVAISQLARCIGPEDSEWSLDLYFGQNGITATHEYLPLARAVDPEHARPRIERELQDANPVKRHAALKLIRWMQLPDSASLASPLVNDADSTTRRLARDLAGQP